MRRSAYATATLLVLLLGAVAIAVQQRGVASRWRSLETARVHAVSDQLDRQHRDLEDLRKSRADLQERLDSLVATRADAGDRATAVSVLADRAQGVRRELTSCTDHPAGTDGSCVNAAFEADQLLGALTRLAQP